MNASKRLVLACSSLFAVLAMAGCGGSSNAAPGCTVDTALAATSVTISGSAFSSNCIKVAAGTTVTFTNSDIITHTVTADGVPAAYDSGNLLPGQTYQHVYGAAGTSTYHCRIHIGMTGTVFVQ
jgi:plastocyanin